MRQKINKFYLGLIIIAISLWFIGINEPFVGAYGANFNYFTLAAKNFIRFGYIKLHFFPTYYSGADLSQNPDFYLHHPILYFTLVSIPFIFFGFHNWTALVTPIIFSLLTLFWFYKIGSLIWNKKIGYLSAFFASIFPMMTVFGKQTIFEPAVLSLLLGVYYCFIAYLKYKHKKYIILLAILSLIATLIDWGGAYFVLPFILLYNFLPLSNQKLKATIIYIISVVLGIALFLFSINFYKKGFSDLVSAIAVRKTSAELFNLSYPWFRLTAATIIRILVYFTPFSFTVFKKLKKSLINLKLHKSNFKDYTLIFFFVFGLINIILLPTASFGHIYFLFYAVPFFSFGMALFANGLPKKSNFSLGLLIIAIFSFSILISLMKWQQVRKQVWRYGAAYEINKLLTPNETIAVYGFPGDIFEQYFFHPTVPQENYENLVDWLSQSDQKRNAVFSCWSICTSEDHEFVESIPYATKQFGQAWLILSSEVKESTVSSIINKDTQELNKAPLILNIYRKARDLIGVGQL